jgi:hypothetical protein
MKFSELEGELIITEKRIDDLETIKSRIGSQLNALKIRTVMSDNVITFKTIAIPISRTGYPLTSLILFRVYKEGALAFEKQKHSLKIRWKVKLDSLYFLALIPSLLIGLISGFNAGTVIALCFGIAFFLVFVFLGILSIKYKLTHLIYSGVYRDYR